MLVKIGIVLFFHSTYFGVIFKDTSRKIGVPEKELLKYFEREMLSI